MDSEKKALDIVAIAAEKKAGHISVIRIGKLSSVAELIVVCSGESDKQTKAIARLIVDEMKKGDDDVRTLGIEGMDLGKWILLDYGDVVVHVFHEPLREYYDIEGLWADAPKLELPEVGGESPGVAGSSA